MKKIYLSIILFIFISPSSFSLNITWTGSTSNSWSDSSNFSPMVVPTLWDTVTIDTTANHPVLSRNATVYKLIMLGDTLDLNSYEIKIGSEGEFRSGVIRNGTLVCNGLLASFSGTEIDVQVNATCSGIQLSGSLFHQTAWFEITGSASSTGEGGNVFHNKVTLKNNSDSSDFILANTSGDVFHDSLIVINQSFKAIKLAMSDVSFFYQAVIFKSSHPGTIFFGKGGGESRLDQDGHLVAEYGDFTSGHLILKSIHQQNNEDHRMVLIPTGGYDSHSLLIVEGCRFSGVMDATAPNVLLKKNVFEGDVMFTKSGGNSDLSHGGNVYLAPANFTNTSTTGQFRLGGGDSDYYHENVTFNSDTLSLIAGNKTFSYFYKNVTVNSPKVLLAYAVWSGDVDQQMEGTATQAYLKLHIEKPNGKAVAQTPIAITGHVKFANGHLETDTTNIITFQAGSGAIDASNKSFVSGPVKKVGDTAFEFPTGKGNYFRSIGTSAPDSISDAFIAEYFDEGQNFSTNIDTSFDYINDCNYWSLQQSSGNSNVYVSLSWDSSYCHIFNRIYSIAVTNLDDSIWVNLGHGGLTGDYPYGSITTDTITLKYGYFSWAFERLAGPDCIRNDNLIDCELELICNGGFEQVDSWMTAPFALVGNSFGANLAPWVSFIPAWYDFSPFAANCDIFLSTNNLPSSGIPNNIHTTCFGGLNTWNGGTNSNYAGMVLGEGLLTDLISPMIRGVDYTLTFQAAVTTPSPNACQCPLNFPAVLDVFGLPDVPWTPQAALFLGSITVGNSNNSTPQWDLYTLNINGNVTMGFAQDIQNIIIRTRIQVATCIPPEPDDPFSVSPYFFIDDVSLRTDNFAFFTNTPPCINAAVDFECFTSDPSATYSWLFGDGSSSTSQNPTHTYSEPGYYEVVLTVSTTSCTDCFRRVIYVSPSCCAINPATVIYDGSNVVPDRITTNTTWSQPGGPPLFKINRTIFVEEDVTLTIDDETIIEFGPEGRIVLERRDPANTTGTAARMVMRDNSLLTSISNSIPGCPVMWQGVEVWGHSNISHNSNANRNAQGMFTMGWEARIANAHNGVILGRTAFPFGDSCNPPIDDVDFPPFNIDFGGGILMADDQNCIFEKNANGIRIFPYRFQNSSLINGCHFIGGQLLDVFYDSDNPSFFYTAANQPNHNPWYNEANTLGRASRGIWVWGNNRMWIFEDNQMYDGIDKGIETFDSNIRTLDNMFTNHRFGIDVFNTFSFNMRATQHHGNTFDQINKDLSSSDPCILILNNAGIRINGGWNDRIWDLNTFGNMISPYVAANDHDQPYDFIGVMVYGSDKTSIKDNDFGQAAIGVYMANSATTSGYIGFDSRGNLFHQNKFGIGTNGANPTLRVRCNLWDTQDYICPQTSSSNPVPVCWINGGNSILPPQQGSSGTNTRKPAGNEFNTSDPFGPDRRINSGFPYVYYHHDQTGNLSTIPIATTATIILFNNGIAKTSFSCPSFTMNVTELRSAIDSLEVIHDSLVIMKEEFEELIDGGNTEDLISAISDTTLTSESLKDSLINNSPLSDQVLYALMNRESYMDEEDFELVMNINLPVSDEVIRDLLRVLGVISDTNIVNSLTWKQGDNPGVYTLFGIQRELENIRIENFSYIYEIADYYLENDSIEEYMELMESVDDINFKMNVIGIYLNNGQTSIVNELLSAIDDSTEAYLDWKNIILMIKSLTDSGKTVFSMDSTMKSMVLAIASKAEPTMAVMNAISIMRLVYGMEFNNFTMDFGFEESRIAHINESKPEKQFITENRNYKVFPNPAKDRIFIQRIGAMRENAMKVDLKMTDITGRLVVHEINFNNESQFELDVTHLKAGFYFISIEDGFGISESHKLILEK